MNRTTCSLFRAAPLCGILAMVVSCAQPELTQPRERTEVELPPVSTAVYTGRPPAIIVHRMGEIPERGHTVEVRLDVPSGGHRLILDHGEVVEGEAMMFLTIEQPAEDEVVTMAFETLRATLQTDRRFDLARVYVRTHRRGDAAPDAYRFAGEKRVGHSSDGG